MKNRFLKLAAISTIVGSFGGIALAVPVTGNITFAGGAQLNTSSAGTATEVVSWTGTGGSGNPIVITDDGSFADILAGSDVTFAAPWSFHSGSVPSFWSAGGFTFNLISSSIAFQGGKPRSVTVDGTGTITGNGYDPTTGTWSFTTQDPSAGRLATFSFSAATGSVSTAPTVPDGGATAALLGASLLGIGFLKRKNCLVG